MLTKNVDCTFFWVGFCDKIYNWINEIVSFVPGDNGMPVYYHDNTKVEVDTVVREKEVAY